MRYCTNKDCPHRVRTGAPAEYRANVSTCGECGSELSAQAPRAQDPAAPLGWPAPLRRRLWITAGLGLLALLLPLTPSPFVNADAAAVGAGSWMWASRHFGPFALGIVPLLSSFLLVELAALIVPRWNRRRHGDPPFRHRLTVAALALGLFLAVLQGYVMAVYLESLSLSAAHLPGAFPTDSGLLDRVGMAFRLQYTLTLVGGTALLAMLALAISRYGVGNGFAVLILLNLLSSLPTDVSNGWTSLRIGSIAPFQLLFYCLGLLLVTLGIAWALNRPARWARGELPLPLPVCGTWPLELAVPLALLPVQLSTLIHIPWLHRLADLLTPGSPDALRIELGVILFTAPIAAWLFFWRFKEALATAPNAMAWFRARLYSTGFLLGLALAWYLLLDIAGEHLRPGLTLLVLVVGVTIVSDLWSEVRARRHAPDGADLVPLASYQHPVEALLDLDEQPGREGAVVQGLRYRSLSYFFGPIVPLRVLGVGPGEKRGELTSSG